LTSIVKRSKRGTSPTKGGGRSPTGPTVGKKGRGKEKKEKVPGRRKKIPKQEGGLRCWSMTTKTEKRRWGGKSKKALAR